MNDVMGLLFAYSDSKRMGQLSVPRTTSSIPFGGNYRALDFMLSNMVNAGCRDVGVVLREGYQSLLDHLGSGRDWDLSRKNGGLVLLPPFGYNPTMENRGYDASVKGKMSALINNLSYIRNTRKKYVILGEGRVILNIRLEPFIDEHIRSGADITMVSAAPLGESTRGIYVTTDESSRVTDINTYHSSPGQLESLGIYILERTALLDLIDYGIVNDMSYFERGVLRTLLPELHIHCKSHHGFVAKLQTIEGYFNSSMELLDRNVRRDLFNPDNPIYTRVRDFVATYYGDESDVTNSLVADGCHIEGKVENSILFRGVHIAPGAVVKNSIVMTNGKIGKNTFLNYIIADKLVTVTDDSMLVGSTRFPVVINKGHTV
ncbi:MAG: glucose-1-phosphate adenylyltransferase subunit GlgD [Clostridiales bacterium]|nr:glucose-1-phosphate adenylyltransferase subunit GlgD [Clostridiales bacterium]